MEYRLVYDTVTGRYEVEYRSDINGYWCSMGTSYSDMRFAFRGLAGLTSGKIVIAFGRNA